MSAVKNQSIITGHNQFKYKVDVEWGNLNFTVNPVNDCHEMVMDKSGLLYLLTNETRNNIIVYNKDGKAVSTWGNTYPGGHGLTISDEGGEGFLYLTDTVRHQVIKTTLQGKEVMVLDIRKRYNCTPVPMNTNPPKQQLLPTATFTLPMGMAISLLVNMTAMVNI
jgi:peptidylamidoglycolate lyase